MYLTFDVETRGLYGDAFAFGYVVHNSNGELCGEGIHVCPIDGVSGDMEGTGITEETATPLWVRENVLPHLPEPDCVNVYELRKRFGEVFYKYTRMAADKGEPFYLVSDVAYPCETGFLRQCRSLNTDFSVYPLLDVSSVLLATGHDPVGYFGRLPEEMPAHNPLADAKQSARILHSVLKDEAI